MRYKPFTSLFAITLLVALSLTLSGLAEGKKVLERTLPTETDEWDFTLSGSAGKPGDRSYVKWSLSPDGIFKRQQGFKKLGEVERCKLTPEEVHEFYVNAAKLIHKGEQDSRPAEGDGMIITLKIASPKSEMSEKFYGEFSEIAKNNPEFTNIEKILGNHTFMKPASK